MRESTKDRGSSLSGPSSISELRIKLSKAKLIIFDCDGVVVDSENIFKASQKEVLGQQDIHLTEKWLTQNTHGFQLGATLDAVEATFGKKIDRAAFCKQYGEMLTKRFTSCVKPVKGIARTCGVILDQSKQICLATNGEADVTDLKLRTAGVASYFDARVRFFAAEVSSPKPAPDIFILAAESMGYAPNDCIVIEDSQAGVRAAKAAGIFTIGFLGGSHTAVSGKREYTQKLRTAGANTIVGSYAALLKFAF